MLTNLTNLRQVHSRDRKYNRVIDSNDSDIRGGPFKHPQHDNVGFVRKVC